MRVKGVWGLVIRGLLTSLFLYQGFDAYTSQRAGDGEVQVEGWVSGMERVEVKKRRGTGTFYIHTVTFTNPVTGELEKVASSRYQGDRPSLGDPYDVFVSADGSARVAEGNAAWAAKISLIVGFFLGFSLLKTAFGLVRDRTRPVDESHGAVRNDQT